MLNTRLLHRRLRGISRGKRLDHVIAAAVTTFVISRYHLARGQARHDGDRGSIVSTIILVAGFAALAVVILLAVTGKVKGWIAKIPDAGSAP